MVDYLFCKSIKGRRIHLRDSEDTAHLFTSLSVSSRRFSTELDAILQLYPSLIPQKNSTIDQEIVSRFESLCYRFSELAEVFEGISSHIPVLKARAHKSSLKAYHADVKSHFRDWILICNKVKHNSNQIVPVTARYSSGRFALGFSLISPQGKEAYAINKDLHRGGERCYSYVRALRKMIFDLTKVDRSLSSLVSEIEEQSDCNPLDPPSVKMIRVGALQKLDEIPITLFANEGSKLHTFLVQDDQVHWNVTHTSAPLEQATISVKYTADGMARTYPIM